MTSQSIAFMGANGSGRKPDHFTLASTADAPIGCEKAAGNVRWRTFARIALRIVQRQV